jgi:hypothetical protein
MFIALLAAADPDVKRSVVRCVHPLIGHRDRSFLSLLIGVGFASALFSALSSSHPLLNADIFTAFAALLPLSGKHIWRARISRWRSQSLRTSRMRRCSSGWREQRLLAFIRALCDDRRCRRLCDCLLAVALTLIRDTQSCG